MPELPEVEALAADLTTRLTGRRISALHLAQFSALKTVDPSLDDLVGRAFGPVRRHGKFLAFALGDAFLVTHLARAGWVHWRAEVPALPPKPSAKSPVALRVVLTDDDPPVEAFDLTEAGTRKSLALWVVRDVLDVPRLATLGPDPLSAEFTVEVVAQILSTAGRKQLKGVLRDQSVIAGIGNGYSDEITWAMKLSPYKPANQVDPAELWQAIRATLSDAVMRSTGVAAAALKQEKKSNLAVHGRAGDACPRCGDTIREVSFADSALQYCPTCQTGGKPLADRRMSKLLK